MVWAGGLGPGSDRFRDLSEEIGTKCSVSSLSKHLPLPLYLHTLDGEHWSSPLSMGKLS